MRIAVIGAGALGCLFGGRLAASGQEVTLVHYRQPYVDHLNNRGLRVESDLNGSGPLEVAVSATTNAATVGPVDLAMIFVKAHQTEIALDQHTACFGPDTTVLSLQNGLRHYDVLREAVGPERALAGVTYQGAVIREPGVVTHTSNGVSAFGGEASSVDHIATALEDAGFPIERVADPRSAIWAKQLISLPIKPLAALTRLTNGELVADKELVNLMAAIIAEAEAVADARNIDLPNKDYLNRVQNICEGATDHRSSMLQDVLAERKTEIDAVNGAVVDLAAEEGIPVPTNKQVTRLVRGLERSYLEE